MKRGSTMVTEQQLANFAVKVDKRSHDECWEWLASKDRHGYGQIRLNGETYRAHRMAWALFFGDIPEGKLILHKCNNRACVNPYHLYVGNYRDNALDAIEAGYCPKFKNVYHPPAKLYDEEIWLIRRLLYYKIAQRIVAKMFKVSQSVISRINKQSDYPTKGSALKGGKTSGN